MVPKLKILVITALYPPHHLGGYELRCQDVVERLRERGHQVLVITSIYGVGKRVLGNGVARALHLEPSRNLWQRIYWDTRDLQFIDRTIKSYQPDVIHLWHMAQLARTIFPFLAQRDVPIVYDEGGIGLLLAWQGHGRWLGFCEGRSRSWFKHRFKRIFCGTVSLLTGGVLPSRWKWPEKMFVYFNSAFTRERHREAGVPIENARVIHSGIELSRFPYRKHSPLSSELRLCVPGRVAPEKGVEDALEALYFIKDMCLDREVHLEIVGAVQDPTYWKMLSERATLYGLNGRVRFLTQMSYERMYEVYHRSDICLLLTRIPESFSRVPLEAMACGTAVVTTATGGVAEVVQNNETGFVVPVADPKAVADVVWRLWNDRILYERITSAARRIVERKFDIGRVIEEIEQVLIDAALS